MICIRCEKKTCENIIYCDTCQAENTAYHFLSMIVSDYHYFLKNGGQLGQFQKWFMEGLGPTPNLKIWKIDINVLVDSKLGTG